MRYCRSIIRPCHICRFGQSKSISSGYLLSTSVPVEALSVRSVVVKGITRYWGFLLFAILIMAWWSSAVGPPVLLALSLVSTFYFLFRAPVWCGAVNRDETLCRKNASGLLMGCSYRQHKWQKLKGTVARHGWRQLNRGLWVSRFHVDCGDCVQGGRGRRRVAARTTRCRGRLHGGALGARQRRRDHRS